MRIHRLSFLILLISVATTATTRTAGAADSPHGFHGLYGGVAGGANLQRDQDFGGASGTVEFDKGGLGGASLGYAFASGLRTELELVYRKNSAESSGGSEEARAGMANLWYAFRPRAFAPRLRPYLGVGAGSAEVSLEQLSDGTSEPRTGEDTVFAYQGGAGLDYEASRRLVLSLGYRYFGTDKARFEGQPGTEGDLLTPGSPATDPVEARYRSDGVLAGLRFSFGRASALPVAAAAPERAEVAAFETVVLRPVNFQYDRADLTAPSQDTLDEIAARLESHADMKVLIEGHADETGTAEYNQQLGQRRAEAVRDYLVGKGVDATNLEVASRGQSQPVSDNTTPEGRARNRRAEFSATEQPRNVKIVIEGPTEASVDAAQPDDASGR